VADYWNKTAVVRALGGAMRLANDACDEVCGDWWCRHVTAYDSAHEGEF
jgi:hypothetical protein